MVLVTPACYNCCSRFKIAEIDRWSAPGTEECRITEVVWPMEGWKYTPEESENKWSKTSNQKKKSGKLSYKFDSLDPWVVSNVIFRFSTHASLFQSLKYSFKTSFLSLRTEFKQWLTVVWFWHCSQHEYTHNNPWMNAEIQQLVGASLRLCCFLVICRNFAQQFHITAAILAKKLPPPFFSSLPSLFFMRKLT